MKTRNLVSEINNRIALLNRAFHRSLVLRFLAVCCLVYPLSAVSSSPNARSKAFAFRTDGPYGHPSTELQNITPGSALIPVPIGNGPSTAQSQAIQPAYSEGGSSAFVVNFDESAAVVDFAWWDLTTCQSSQMVPYLYTPPAYGTVTYSFGTGTVTSSPCTGTVVPVTQIYYTWNTHSSASLYDFFEVHANDPEGDQFDWIAQPELLAKSNGKCHGATCGDPINIGTGNVFEQADDYGTVGQNKLSYIRYYNSVPVPSTFASTLGALWRSNYDRYLNFVSSSLVVAERPDGQLINFYNNNGTWTSDSDADYTLTQSGTAWSLKDQDDTVETYTPLKGTSAGLLGSITLRNGYTQSMTYDRLNELKSVSDSYRRQLAFTYSNGLLSTLTTADGLVLTYGYNGINTGSGIIYQLASVSYSTSPVMSQRYLYQDPNSLFALTSIVDENGNPYKSWVYDSTGRAVSNQVGGVANLTTVSYNGDGTKTVTNAFGVADTYTFSILQDTPKVTQVSRAATSTTAAATETFTYDSNGYLSGETDWNGNQTTYVNDIHGNPTTINEAVGTSAARTTTISYDPVFVHLPDTVTTPGLTTSFTYDNSGNTLTKKLTDTGTQSSPYSTNGSTRTWQYTWQNSLLSSVQTPRTDVVEKTTYTYDSSGALTGITNGLNQTTAITSHTSAGLPLTIVDPNGLTTNLLYDPRQRLISSTVTLASKSKKSPSIRVTTYSYDAAENLVSLTQPDGSGLTFTYDSAHRLTALKDLLGQKVSYSLDALGDLQAINVSNSSGTTTSQHSNTFDALGRMLQDIGASGQTSSYSYDPAGNVVIAADQSSNTTQRAYDALNRLQQITDPANGITIAGYDAHSRPLNIKSPSGGTTAYVYDGFGEVIQESSPNSGTTVYYYDGAGNQVKRIAATGAVTQYTYDALDRVLTTIFPSDGTENVTYNYDQSGHGYGIGRLTSASDAAGTLSRTYDQLGNLLTDVRTTGTAVLTTSYSYDAANRIASITYPSGALVSYTRDSMGRITFVAVQPKGGANTPVASSITYEPFGAYAALTYGNGISETRAFDEDYRLTAITDSGAASPIQSLSYGYYPTNNVQTITDAVNAGNSKSFGYDNLQRLTAAQGAYGSFGFTYDANGNRLSQTLGSVTTNYGYSQGSDLLISLSVGGALTQMIGYTADGRIASLNPGEQTPGSQLITSLTYNQDARLAAINSGSQTLASYTYDGFGQRLLKSISSTYGEIYQYGQDGKVLEETNASGAVQADYIYLDGRPIATLTPSGALYFLHDDMLGSPQFATDGGQNVAWQASYQPFGQTSSVSGTLTQNLRLPGQYFDLESGWNHNGFRNYLPDLGRYAEPDPLALQGGGRNLSPTLGRFIYQSPISLFGGTSDYAYVGNNPTSAVDDLGLRWIVVTIWNQQGFSVGHAAAFELNGNNILSEFPQCHCHKSTLLPVQDYNNTLQREGRQPDRIFKVWIPNDAAFNNAAGRESKMPTWDWDPNTKSQTNCVNAITRAMNRGGVPTPTFLWPGNFGDWLSVQALDTQMTNNVGETAPYPVYSLSKVPW